MTDERQIQKPTGSSQVPSLIACQDSRTKRAFASFFTDNIRNKNTRSAYLHAATCFFEWCDTQRLQLEYIESFHVAAYVEHLGERLSIPSVKQHLAALRMLFDWLVIKQVCENNPAHSVRGPRLQVRTGKTPALSEGEARQLLESISPDTVIGLRDRALIAMMTYTFARITAVLQMNVEDYEPRGRRMWVNLLEKGNRVHAIPAHHKLEEYLDAYIEGAGLANDPQSPLFRSMSGRAGHITNNRLQRRNAYSRIRRRALEAGIRTRVCNHTFRATGITNFLTNKGSLEMAQQMAAHADARTTKLYDRRNDQVSLDEIERITI